MWIFADHHPYISILAELIVAGVVTSPLRFALTAYTRTMRARNIFLHGWPTPPLDADGDIVYPKKR